MLFRSLKVIPIIQAQADAKSDAQAKADVNLPLVTNNDDLPPYLQMLFNRRKSMLNKFKAGKLQPQQVNQLERPGLIQAGAITAKAIEIFEIHT